jgi:uncharacterized membrane protein
MATMVGFVGGTIFFCLLSASGTTAFTPLHHYPIVVATHQANTALSQRKYLQRYRHSIIATASFAVATHQSNIALSQRKYLHNSKIAATTALKAVPSPPEAVATLSKNVISVRMQLFLIISSVFMLSWYHISLMMKERSSTKKTWRQYQADAREDWSQHVRKTQAWLYAIQTLRNAITAQTFLATTTLSLLTLITGKLWDVLRNLGRGTDRRMLTVQLISVALCMLSSAYYFLQGVRLMTHAGFMFPVSEGTKVDNLMRKSESCQWLGLRWMYISLGPIAWSVGGSRALFVVSWALLIFFRQIDRQPEGMELEEFQGYGI